MSGDLICPNCGTGVPNDRLVGIEVRGVYDGVLFWRDERCGHQWPRFPAPGRLYDAATRIIGGDK